MKRNNGLTLLQQAYPKAKIRTEVYFYRDAVHANEADEQILAKILMSFFRSPE